MVNDTQILFQNFPLGPLEVAPYKVHLEKVGAYVNGKTSGMHSNEGGR